MLRAQIRLIKNQIHRQNAVRRSRHVLAFVPVFDSGRVITMTIAKGRIVERHAAFEALACRANFQLISKKRLADESVVEEKVGSVCAPRVKKRNLRNGSKSTTTCRRQTSTCLFWFNSWIKRLRQVGAVPTPKTAEEGARCDTVLEDVFHSAAVDMHNQILSFVLRLRHLSSCSFILLRRRWKVN
jgi:hypothetical protein